MSVCFSIFVQAPAAELTKEDVLAETLHPFAGASVRGVDTTTLSNVCGEKSYKATWPCANDDVVNVVAGVEAPFTNTEYVSP